MPGSMWDQGAPPSSAPPAYHQDGLGTQRASMWDQGRPGVSQPGFSQPSQSMWDQGAPRPSVMPGTTPQATNRPPAPVVARPTQAPLMGPQGPQTGNIKRGTVKSYSVVKGFGFILTPEIPQDIYFGRDSLQADLRTSDVAGTQVTFELIRAPDGKPQGRNLRPIGNAPPTAAQVQAESGNADGRGFGGAVEARAPGPAPVGGCGQMQPQPGCWPGRGMMASPPMPMGQMGMGCFPGKGGGCINPAFLGKPGFPPMMPTTGGPGCFPRPGFPMMSGQMPGAMPGMMRPGMPGMAGMLRPGMPGAGGCLGQQGMMNGKGGQDRKRDWSPHAGSRAIRSAIKPASEAGSNKRSKSKSASRSRSRSRTRKSSSSKSSSSRSRSRKKKRKKKKKKKKKGRSSSTISSSSSRSKNKDDAVGDDADKAAASGENPDVQKAKMEALQKLREMQSVEPKEERSKQFRALLREWHPDKNPEKTEVATAVFQFLQKGKNLLNLK